jgi:hypothetical protein
LIPAPIARPGAVRAGHARLSYLDGALAADKIAAPDHDEVERMMAQAAAA